MARRKWERRQSMRTNIAIDLLCFLTLILIACVQEKKEETLGCGVLDEPVSASDTRKQMPAIFSERCATCHVLEATTTGPKISGVLDRIPNEHWFDGFIRNEDAFIKQKEPYTLLLNKQSLPIQFSHNFKDLSEEQIEELKAYSRK